ncbi:hypothetical protein aq_370 [Aquifex aeolicus VF5]|uniref:CRISPR-associated exonuclease Cas4 n=2 Tax=Aquifex aeolicus TaxID=63363 RepID=O66693_AQUAE|nr:hypothetical protein aq_370 [Aquifex aeolicus VF5]
MKMTISYEEITNLKFTGTQVAYYVICKRKLWLFSKGLSYESESEFVELGKLLDERAFKREKEEVEWGENPVKIDFLTGEEGLVVHEVKHSPKLEEAHVLQVKYYLWFLEKSGVKVSHGIIHYPKQRKVLRVELTQEDRKVIVEALENIQKVLLEEKPPEVIKKPYCKKCAYYEFCYG